LIYIHGGEFVFGGGVSSFGKATCRLIDSLVPSLAVVRVNYITAPESKFPDIQKQCWNVLKNIHEILKVSDDIPLLLGGDSAGGNIAIGLGFLSLKKKKILYWRSNIILSVDEPYRKSNTV